MSATITVGKLDVGRRQLQTAIWLFFNDGDPVSTHALAFAAYEIAHTISKKRNPERPGLIFDSIFVHDELRAEFNKAFKRDANFFKHGDRDGDAVIQFNPALTEAFILFAILGFELCGERKSNEEGIFVWWLSIHRPDLLKEGETKQILDASPTDKLEEVRRLSRRDFFKQFMDARRLAGH